MKFSVIIPTWNEGPHIGASLRRLRDISDSSRMEVILVDGQSSDHTVAKARLWVDKVLILERPNRGAQLHAGAKAASGDFLFFLHADTQLTPLWQQSLERYWIMSKPKASATVFRVDYGSHWDYRLIALWQNMRVRLRQVAYGDQGFCTTPELYARCGGFPEIPIMEDVVFCRRLRKHGPIVLLKDPIYPAARRLRRYGPLANGLRNFWLRTCFALGVSPETLWRRYYAASALNPQAKQAQAGVKPTHAGP